MYIGNKKLTFQDPKKRHDLDVKNKNKHIHKT